MQPSNDTPQAVQATERRHVPIELIDIKPASSVRCQRYEKTVRTYTRALKNGARFPAISLHGWARDTSPRYFLADGLHRIEAHRERSRAKILGQITWHETEEAARLAAWMEAVQANGKHGRRRSKDDTREAIRACLLNLPDLAADSDRAVATHCRASHKTVRLVRESLSALGMLTGNAHASTRNYDLTTGPRAGYRYDGKGGAYRVEAGHVPSPPYVSECHEQAEQPSKPNPQPVTEEVFPASADPPPLSPVVAACRPATPPEPSEPDVKDEVETALQSLATALSRAVQIEDAHGLNLARSLEALGMAKDQTRVLHFWGW